MRKWFAPPVLALLLSGVFGVVPLASQAATHVPVSSEHDWPAFIGDYPKAGSEALKADLAILLWLQRSRSHQDIVRASHEVILRPGIFNDVLGVNLDSGPYPLTRALLANGVRELGEVSGALKVHFSRPRPYDADSRIKPAVDLEHSFSYPSGHASRGVMYSMILASLMPSRKDAILDQGRVIGNDRVIAGVHYPSDVEAGQRLGAEVAAQWLQRPEVKHQLEEARASEWGGAKP